MQPKSFVDEASHKTVRTHASGHLLRVVIAYDAIAAGKRAMRVITRLGGELGESVEFQPLPWSFELLADTDWAKVAADDAVKADILIIATSTAHPLPSAVEHWAEATIHRKQGTWAAVVALFGTEGDLNRDGAAQLEAIRTAARRAGLDFFAPALRQEIDEAIARIHQRSEMLTPVLEEILQRQ